jgi:hypothetical protein
MRNNTRKSSPRRRRSHSSPKPELQWLEDGVHTFVKIVADCLYNAGMAAADMVDRVAKQRSARR